MEKELNIAAILKDKPQNTRLWSPIFGDVYLKDVTDVNNNMIRITHHGVDNIFMNNGKVWADGDVCLFPSRRMDDWQKFAWKKGDVLVDTGFDNINCIFDAYISEDYTRFRARYCYRLSPCSNDIWFSNPTQIFSTKEFMKDPCQSIFIKKIEEHYKGKLNLETLKIEKAQPEFKDGDILHSDKTEYSDETIFIAKISDGVIGTYAYIDLLDKSVMMRNDTFKESEINAIRLATDSEKQQLFDALAKEGKRWNPYTKSIEDLPKKYEFKPFDKVLVRDYLEDKWMPNFFSCYDGTSEYKYGCIAGNSDNVVFSKYCIPYNEETAKLIGTTNNVEG